LSEIRRHDWNKEPRFRTAGMSDERRGQLAIALRMKLETGAMSGKQDDTQQRLQGDPRAGDHIE
jgi:hypothetical protein